jgi:hypothetical protein
MVMAEHPHHTTHPGGIPNNRETNKIKMVAKDRQKENKDLPAAYFVDR